MGSFADVRFSRLGILRKTEMNCSRAFFLCESPKFLLLFSTFLFPFFFFSSFFFGLLSSFFSALFFFDFSSALSRPLPFAYVVLQSSVVTI